MKNKQNNNNNKNDFSLLTPFMLPVFQDQPINRSHWHGAIYSTLRESVRLLPTPYWLATGSWVNFINSLCPCSPKWRYRSLSSLVQVLPESILTYQRFCGVFTWEQFHKKCSLYEGYYICSSVSTPLFQVSGKFVEFRPLYFSKNEENVVFWPLYFSKNEENVVFWPLFFIKIGQNV